MKAFLIASVALSVLAIAPASAQMMGGSPGGGSCVSGGQFVPCGAPAMQPGGAGMAEPEMAEPKARPRRAAKRGGKKRS